MKLSHMNNSYLGSRTLILSLLIISFGVLTWFVMHESVKPFELAVYSVLSRFNSPEVTNVMVIITNLGSTTAIVMCNIVILALPLTRRIFGLSAATNSILTALLNAVLKSIFARKRPNVNRLVTENGYGYPSGHTMSSTALYTIILLTVFKFTKSNRIRMPVQVISIIPFFIGISRIYLGVHHAGDVLAGWIMGVAVALLVETVYSILYGVTVHSLVE